MQSVRAFIAILPPPDLLAGVEMLLRKLRASNADFRWESVEKLHATVKFLGNVEESKLPALYDEMGKSARGLGPFDVVFEHLGAFPNAKHPRVVWLGCRDVSGSLGAYKQRLDDAFASLGFEKDEHPYRPHVTLGRAKSQRAVPHLLSLLENLTFEPRSASIDGIVVLKSVLQPQGAEYSLLHAIRLPPP